MDDSTSADHLQTRNTEKLLIGCTVHWIETSLEKVEGTSAAASMERLVDCMNPCPQLYRAPYPWRRGREMNAAVQWAIVQSTGSLKFDQNTAWLCPWQNVPWTGS